jgi:hypothetical protein
MGKIKYELCGIEVPADHVLKLQSAGYAPVIRWRQVRGKGAISDRVYKTEEALARVDAHK